MYCDQRSQYIGLNSKKNSFRGNYMRKYGNQSFSENNNNNYSNPNRKFSRATSYAESFQGLIHHIVSPNWFTYFQHKFFQVRAVEKEKKFLISTKQFVFSQFTS